MKELDELLYEGDFKYIVNHKCDDNGHLNNANYFVYCEYVRADFLSKFGWSDKYFNSIGIAQNRRKYGESTFRKSLFKDDYIKINLKLTKGKKIFFHMHFKFYDKDENFVFDTSTFDFFVNAENKNIPIPDFFLKALAIKKI